jgi:hypothetical protein
MATWNAEAKAQVIEHVLSQMAQGEPLTRILRNDLMPHPGTWLRWCEDDGVLRERYARARLALGDHVAESVLAIADTATDSDSASAARVRVDARRWFAGKVNPQYSEQMNLSVGGQGLTIVLGRYEPKPVLEHEKAPLPITSDMRSTEE